MDPPNPMAKGQGTWLESIHGWQETNLQAAKEAGGEWNLYRQDDAVFSYSSLIVAAIANCMFDGEPASFSDRVCEAFDGLGIDLSAGEVGISPKATPTENRGPTEAGGILDRLAHLGARSSRPAVDPQHPAAIVALYPEVVRLATATARPARHSWRHLSDGAAAPTRSPTTHPAPPGPSAPPSRLRRPPRTREPSPS